MAYSFSQIQTYLSCPLKYCYEKIDKLTPDTRHESLHLILGTTVHETLENLYTHIGNTKLPTLEVTQQDFLTIWTAELTRVEQVHGKDYFEVETLEDFFQRGEKYINWYYNHYYPFDQEIAMKTEESISFDVDEHLKFRGKIDRLDINNDTLTIIDYKTSRSLPKDGNNSIEEQITLYGLGIQKDYGKQIKKIMGKVIYLHMEREYQREITQEKIENIKQKYLQIMQEIEEKKEKYQNGENEIFEPKAGYACQYCPFLQICPLYKHQYIEDEIVKEQDFKNEHLASTTIRNLIEKYVVVQEQYKNLESQKKMIAQILTDYANAHDCKNLYSETHKLSIANKESYSLNKATLDELTVKLENLGLLDEVQTIDYHKLGKKFKEEELNYDDYQDLVEKKVSRYISRVGKKK